MEFSAGTWGTVADWLLAILALSTVLVAWFQIRAASSAANAQIRASAEHTLAQITAATEAHNKELEAALRDAKDQTQIARANLLMEIDRDYESAEMQESRLALRGLRNEIAALVINQNQALDKAALHAAINDQFGAYLNKLWLDFKNADWPDPKTDLDGLLKQHLNKVNTEPEVIQPHERAGLHYQRLTRVLGWLERVGYMANQKLLPQDDIKRLYDFVFIELGFWFEKHITYRQEDGPLSNRDFMKEFVNFRKVIEKEKKPKIVEEDPSIDGVSGF